MKRTLFIGMIFWLLHMPMALAQEAGSWLVFSEVTPFSRADFQRPFSEVHKTFNLEWRNRVGLKVAENLAVGVIGGFRKYEKQEFGQFSGQHTSTSYINATANTLWNSGAFVTWFFPVTPRFQLQANTYGIYEQGQGAYSLELQYFVCPNCSAFGGFQNNIIPGTIEERELREMNFYAGLEIGASYALTPSLAIQSSVNMFQYEKYRASFPQGQELVRASPTYREIEHRGEGFSTILSRPIIHLGVLLSFR
jgi:hypothetical protein